MKISFMIGRDKPFSNLFISIGRNSSFFNYLKIVFIHNTIKQCLIIVIDESQGQFMNAI